MAFLCYKYHHLVFEPALLVRKAGYEVLKYCFEQFEAAKPYSR